MNYNFNCLKTFLTLSETQSFTKTAEREFLSQPAISRQIKTLEEYYNIKLFDRIGKRVLLTQEGKLFLFHVKKIFESVDALEISIDNFKKLIQGSIGLGVVTTIGVYALPKILAEFRKLYPGIETHIQFGSTEEIVGKVFDGLIELGIVANFPDIPQIAKKFYTINKAVTVIPPTYSISNRKSISIAELCKLPFIRRESGSNTRAVIEEELKKREVQLNVVLELSNIDSIKNAVEQELGISILPEISVRREIEHNFLKQIEVETLDLHLDIFVINLKKKNFSNPLKVFFNFLFEKKEMVDNIFKPKFERYT